MTSGRVISEQRGNLPVDPAKLLTDEIKEKRLRKEKEKKEEKKVEKRKRKKEEKRNETDQFLLTQREREREREREKEEEKKKRKKEMKEKKKTIWQRWLSLDINLSIVPSFFFYDAINSNWNTGYYFKRLKTFANANHTRLNHPNRPTIQAPAVKLSCATRFLRMILARCFSTNADY